MNEMTPARWEQIQELYHAARALGGADRARFLQEACAGDDLLCREVQALLDQPVSTGSFVEFLGGAAPHVDAHAPNSLAGRSFGSYRVVSLAGRGGMGEVYRARDSRLDRDVAIKVLPAHFTTDAERLARFGSEARVLAALNHPHIGAIYGLEDVEGTPALVLEFVEGETLADHLRRGPVPVRDALPIARQIADALDAAHRKGIIHRDLKPANIKLTPGGVVKVLDFGLAKAATADAAVSATRGESQASTIAPAPGVTRVGVILGTASYMSPEQARGLPVDARADIWAFGCVLYELLTRRPPFTGPTVAETFAAILERSPDWSSLPRSTPAAIRELLRRCLEKDAARRLQDIAEARDTIARAERGWNLWRAAAIAAAAVAVAAVGAGLWMRGPAGPIDRSEWVQLTQFSDSVIHPALSPDGKMISFVRGPSNPSVPFAPGQVYVKQLPDGEPVRLTNDALLKMSPVFSPDGSRIVYTAVTQQFAWDSWTVPVLGGGPRRWQPNASGLLWAGPGRLLFSEMKKPPHMAIVTAGEERERQRDVYVPEHTQGMAHLSYASPDRQSVLLVEMDQNHAWTPCRVVPMDGSSTGRLVGPAGAACTFGAWSPDGRWVYVTSRAGGVNHIWRQRFPDGAPEQVTSGPTEEEGIAMAPDGRSLVTAVALRNSSLWLSKSGLERQISIEGNAVDARFTRDGKRLLYRAVTSLGDYPLPGVLRVTNLDTGHVETLLPEFQTIDYDVSADGQQVVIEAADAAGVSRMWLARLDGRLPPRQIPNIEAKQPRFGPDDAIHFRRPEGGATFVYRIYSDGTGMKRVVDQPIALMGRVSPDGRWIIGWNALWFAFSLDGARPPVTVGGPSLDFEWSPDGSSVAFSTLSENHSYLVPLRAGEMLPPIPADGFRNEQEIARLPSARRMPVRTVPGPSIDVYAFYRVTTQRNLFRIPIR
jgi:eukaryotic-like serine/threonine-protein kinase